MRGGILRHDVPCVNKTSFGYPGHHMALSGACLLCKHNKHTSVNTVYITLLLRLSTKNHFVVTMLLEFGLTPH